MKFSIRDLLLVTVIVALAVGWWVDHRRQAMKEQRLVKLQKEADAKLRMLDDLVLIPVTRLKTVPAAGPPAASMYPPGDYLTPPPALKTKLESDRPSGRVAP